MYEKLLESYKYACKDFVGNETHKSNHWKRYYNDVEKFCDLENIINFRQILSEGLDDSNKNISLKEVVDCFNDLGEKFVMDNLCKKNIGNSPYVVRFKDVFVDNQVLTQLYWYNDLREHVFKGNKIKSVCEIGGGFGSFARIILNNHRCKYACIDLPEANIMTGYYIHEYFPGLKIYLYSDYVKKGFVSKKDYEKFDVFILPPWCIFDDDIKFDLFINTRSMMEMNMDVISKYFDFIHEHISNNGYFFNLNRYIKYMKDTGDAIRLCDYPYGLCWDVCVSKTAHNQKRLHLLLTKKREGENHDFIIEIENICNKTRSFNDSFLERETYFKKTMFNFIKKTLLMFLGKKKLHGLLERMKN